MGEQAEHVVGHAERNERSHASHHRPSLPRQQPRFEFGRPVGIAEDRHGLAEQPQHGWPHAELDVVDLAQPAAEHLAHRLARDVDLSGGRRCQRPQAVHQGRLGRAGREGEVDLGVGQGRAEIAP